LESLERQTSRSTRSSESLVRYHCLMVTKAVLSITHPALYILYPHTSTSYPFQAPNSHPNPIRLNHSSPSKTPVDRTKVSLYPRDFRRTRCILPRNIRRQCIQISAWKASEWARCLNISGRTSHPSLSWEICMAVLVRRASAPSQVSQKWST
jgi:hypothetical protein